MRWERETKIVSTSTNLAPKGSFNRIEIRASLGEREGEKCDFVSS
jgi:hypothetical protein